MERPLIGITSGTFISEGGTLPGLKKLTVNYDYIHAVELSGGIPLILPVISDSADIERQFSLIDGLILSGGGDICPLLHGEEPAEKLGSVDTERDIYEIKVIRQAYRLSKPILGICRGIQILNVAFGGTLYQDTSYRQNAYVKHMQQAAKHIGTHTVDFMAGTKLYEIFGSSTKVNSFHHQAIKDLAPGFVLSAAAKDGVVEGIEMTGGEFVVAVQWHPEMMLDSNPAMLKLFQLFINAVLKVKQQKSQADFILYS